jgi:[ribosomal protein S5]-alanine N-acetyltransferase
MHIILETPRLILRRFTNSDADAGLILELNSDPEVLKYLHEPPLQDLNQAREILQHIILPQYEINMGRWATHLKDQKKFIGWCGLKYRPGRNEIDLGYRFMQTAWGKGYATEAAAAALAYGFEVLQIKTITASAHIHNTASLSILQKIGMKFIGEDIIDDCPVKTYEALNHSRNPQ